MLTDTAVAAIKTCEEAISPGTPLFAPYADPTERVIVDRLARWTTRDGGSASEVAAAVRSVLDEYLPGR